MRVADWTLLFIFLVLLFCLGKVLGAYLCKVLDPKEKTFLDFLMKPLEKITYRICGIERDRQMAWKEYVLSILAFSALSFGFCFTLIYFQKFLPLNPLGLTSPSIDQVFNTSSSFITNTNWQSAAPETTFSYFIQMCSFTVLNFTSAAVGLAAAAALVRGLVNKNENSSSLGNFWVDIVRISYYLLLPIALCLAIFFISQGTPQNFSPPVKVTSLLDSSAGSSQTIIGGAVASQEAIKLIGTNGGGYMQANSAHPYENPTPLSNFFQMVAIALIPISQIFYFGRKIENTGHANWIFAGLSFLFLLGTAVCSHFEYKGKDSWKNIGVAQLENLEGKEQRFGIFSSTMYSGVTTTVACGAVNSSLGSYTPLGGMVPLMNIEYGEIIFGGIGSGLYSIILYVILSVFIAGLIIGRTPEYLGKKIEPKDMKLVVFVMLAFIFIIAMFTYFALSSKSALSSLSSKGPHGVSEVLYAYSSCMANNGSAFGGLMADNLFYNITLGLSMLFGRFFVMVPMVILGGLFAVKKAHPVSRSSFPMTGFIFLALFLGIIILFGSLTFFPLLVFGPILEFFGFMGKITLGAFAI